MVYCANAQEGYAQQTAFVRHSKRHSMAANSYAYWTISRRQHLDGMVVFTRKVIFCGEGKSGLMAGDQPVLCGSFSLSSRADLSSFFYWRYSHLLSPGLFLALNAILFSLAHTIFMNGLVFALTLAGGFLFANTYRKTQSLMVTSIEHAVYGLWLYTVGLGEMLAFPGP